MKEEDKSLNGIEFEPPLEEEIEQVDVSESKRKVYTEQGDPEVSSLHNKYKRGKLIIQPDFQRYSVWPIEKSSRLIESALLDIPLPVIYLSEGKDGKEYVIDGQQRLTAFFSFIDGRLPDDKEFKLKGLKVFPELNQKTFKEISEELQDKVNYCKIHTITFRRESESDLKFEIFERLNTGAVPLNDQELRNCIYRGPYNELLKELASSSDFMYLLGLKNADKRMKDVELVLRFAAFFHASYLNYKPPMRRFLNMDMEKYLHIKEHDAQELRNAFKNAVTIMKSLLDKHAFKRFRRGEENKPDGYWEPKQFNASLYDIMMGLFAKVDKNKAYQHLDSIREALISLMTDDQGFIDSIEISTSGIQAVRKRFDIWRSALEGIIGTERKGPRCFSYQLKEALYKDNPTCSICGQKIHNIDDAAVDHIEQYWRGGQTIPENARLTHRYCNVARSRLDGSDLPIVVTRRSLGQVRKPRVEGAISREREPKSQGESGLSFRKPIAFTFLGKRVPVSSWADIPPSLCVLLLDKHRADFNKVLEIGGSKKKYFDKNPTNMFEPRKITGSNIYVETNWSSSGTLHFCGKVLIAFGYNDNDLQVDAR